MKKKKVLWVGEFTEMNTGFSVYGKELLKRLYSTGKYEIFELAAYCSKNDQRIKNIPWTIIPNAPNSQDEVQEYNKNVQNQWGMWRFEETLLKIKPDVVLSVRDPWHDSFITCSPFRDKYYFAHMPTVDSAPLTETWLAAYVDADAILTYSEFGRDTLIKETDGKINFKGVASPAADYNIFKPVKDKKEHKKRMGLQENVLIVGTVNRNQKRKLYPELLNAFRDFTEKYPQISKNTYLYCHTQFPDVGWDFPRLIKESGVSHKVLFSYICSNCHYYFPAFFRDAISYCPRCRQLSVKMPGVGLGFTSEQLADVYNLFDVYVQYAICLGKNEQILTKSGWKAIQNVKSGEEVWTHKHRWKRVLNNYKNLPKSYDKKIKKISIYGDYETLTATENHEFAAYTHGEFTQKYGSVREQLGNKIKDNSAIPNPNKYELRQLNIGDLLLYPIDDSIIDIQQIDLANFKTANSIVNDNTILIKYGNGHNYPRFINVDNNLCRFIGLYVADGNSYNNLVKITSNLLEKDNQNLANTILNKLTNKTPTSRIYNNRNGVDNYVSSAIHCNWLSIECKKGNQKRLPEWCMHLPIEKQKEILIGLFMGDGCTFTRRNMTTSLFTTISIKLAEQLKFILRRLRISYNCRYDSRKNANKLDGKHRQPCYRFEIHGDIKHGIFNYIRHNTRNVYLNNYHLLQIKNIEEINYKDDVWCLEVEEDHTMTTKIGFTYQCEGMGMGQIEAAACAVPIMSVNYSAMESAVKNLNGIQINPCILFRECETHAYRAYPDNDDFVKKLYGFLSKPENIRLQKGYETYLLCRKFYDYDKVAALWSSIIDEAPYSEEKWAAPKRIVKPNFNIPNDLSNEQFVYWCKVNILQHIPLNDYFLLQVIRDLNYGQSTTRHIGIFHSEDSALGGFPKIEQYNRERALNEFKEIVNKFNYWESKR